MKQILTIFTLLFLALRSYASAIEDKRYWALGMLESGNDDFAIGPAAGEVSRYQICPMLWSKTVGYIHQGDYRDPVIARGVAKKIMDARIATFIKIHGRGPIEMEWALLWHRPSAVLVHHSKQWSAKEADYAIRFANLVERR